MTRTPELVTMGEAMVVVMVAAAVHRTLATIG